MKPQSGSSMVALTLATVLAAGGALAAPKVRSTSVPDIPKVEIPDMPKVRPGAASDPGQLPKPPQPADGYSKMPSGPAYGNGPPPAVPPRSPAMDGYSKMPGGPAYGNGPPPAVPPRSPAMDGYSKMPGGPDAPPGYTRPAAGNANDLPDVPANLRNQGLEAPPGYTRPAAGGNASDLPDVPANLRRQNADADAPPARYEDGDAPLDGAPPGYDRVEWPSNGNYQELRLRGEEPPDAAYRQLELAPPGNQGLDAPPGYTRPAAGGNANDLPDVPANLRRQNADAAAPPARYEDGDAPLDGAPPGYDRVEWPSNGNYQELRLRGEAPPDAAYRQLELAPPQRPPLRRTQASPQLLGPDSAPIAPARQGGDGYQALPDNASTAGARQGGDGYQALPDNASTAGARQGGDGYQALPDNASTAGARQGGDGYQALPDNASTAGARQGGDGYQALPDNASTAGARYGPLQQLDDGYVAIPEGAIGRQAGDGYVAIPEGAVGRQAGDGYGPLTRLDGDQYVPLGRLNAEGIYVPLNPLPPARPIYGKLELKPTGKPSAFKRLKSAAAENKTVIAGVAALAVVGIAPPLMVAKVMGDENDELRDEVDELNKRVEKLEEKGESPSE